MNDSIGNWSNVSIGTHTAYQYEPLKRNEHGYVLIYLHGVHQGKLDDKPEFIEQLEKFGLPVIAPQTQRSWWTDRICTEFDTNTSAQDYVMEQVVPYIEQEYQVTSPKIALFGTSMGGQGALRLSYKFPDIFPVVAGISPAIDYQNWMRQQEDSPLWQMYDAPEQARQDSATLHIHPLNWPRNQFFCCCPQDADWWDSSDRLRMKLYSLGVPHECELETKGGGHGFPYYNIMAQRVIQFLWDSLEKERRRVV
ncbi:MAG: alpha/beta hydrolase-fold protein [Pirellulales bacterium]